MKTASIIAAVCVLGALAAISLFTDTTYAREPDCPSSWPQEPTEQFFSDSEGAEWFVIRSADSNGYETVRAYRADDGYQTGYVPGSPDEVCYLLVRRPESPEDLAEAQRVVFRAEQEPEETVRAVSKTLFREFYDRLIPEGLYGPNPDPKWGDLFVVFSDRERACIADALGEERLATVLQTSVFPDAEPQQEEVLILDRLLETGCLSEETAGALTFATAFASIVRGVEASGEETPCVQELLDLIFAALSKPSPTEEDLLAAFLGLIACGLEAAAPEMGVPGG